MAAGCTIPSGHVAVTESTISSWPAVRVWGTGVEGEGGALSSCSVKDRSKINQVSEMCRRNCDERNMQEGGGE